MATAYPAFEGWLRRCEDELTHAAVERSAIDAELAPLAALSDEAFRAALRQLAARHRARLALRELLPPSMGGAGIEQSAADISELAEATIAAALAEAERAVFARTGVPRLPDESAGRLTVLGMGKLGGRELNCGSDVDLVCFYDSDEAEARHGERVTSAHEVWTRVVKRMSHNLEDVSEHGFVWRVDHRLRPEGARGPLVNSLAAAERYYEAFGRLWERAALLRARPVAGDIALGHAVLELLAPFVWTRRVEPHIAVQMFELVRRAREELSPAPERDLKLGPGGIREAEFFVQALQLIWGGREPRIRRRATIDAVMALRAAGYVNEREADDLASAYAALRRAEHAVQWSTGVQTHSLPREPRALDRLARALGFDDSAALSDDLSHHTRRVGELLESLLPEGKAPASPWTEALLALDRGNHPAFAAALLEAGMPLDDNDQLARDLFEMARLHPDSPLGARTRERWRHLPETVLGAVAGAADPPQAAHLLRSFAARVHPPAVYTRMLADDPAAITRLVTVLGGSVFVGQAVATRPELMDLVLFERSVPTPGEAYDDVLGARAALDAGDTAGEPVEQLVGALRRVQRQHITQIALADLADEIDPRQVSLVLSKLADGTLEVAARFAMGALDAPVRGLSVIAMGSLGGRAIGYGSDLDVIFLYDPAASGDDDPVAYFTKRARQVIRLIEMPHFEGPGYQLDTRLRPSGSQGLLVASLDAFARYHGVARDGVQAQRAATWERLALLRARAAAGDPALGAEAIRIAELAAYQGDTRIGALAADVHRLRVRMERELARERPGRFDLKLGRGGLVDVEFCVQLLQLEHGADPRVRTPDTREALDALAAIGALAPAHRQALSEGYDFLRRLEQRIRVLHGDGSHLLEERAAGLTPLARRMGIRHRQPAERLLDSYRRITGRVRRAYEEIVVRRADDGAV